MSVRRLSRVRMSEQTDKQEEMNVPECSICYEGLDETTRRPRSLPCGHTICTMCIDMSIKRGDKTCPSCRHPHNVTTASKLPINYALEEIFQKLLLKSCEAKSSNESENRVQNINEYDDVMWNKERIICETKYVKSFIENTVQELQKEMIMTESLIDYQQDQIKQKLAEVELLKKHIQDEVKVKNAIERINSQLEEKRKFLESSVQNIQISESSADICNFHGDVTNSLNMKDFQVSEEYLKPRLENLVKKGDKLGMTIIGPSDLDSRVFINRIKPGGEAQRQGGLKTGDCIITINGQKLDGCTKAYIDKLLLGLRDEIAIEVRYMPVAFTQLREKYKGHPNPPNFF